MKGLYVFTCIVTMGALAGLASLSISTIDALDRVEKTVEVRNDLSFGKANYMPGSACVIAATESTTSAEIVNYARSCAKAHEDWLETQ